MSPFLNPGADIDEKFIYNKLSGNHNISNK